MQQRTQFLKGLVLGGAIAAAALMGYAYGRGGTDEAYETARRELQAQCDVSVGYGSITIGGRCRNDQVMVGYRDDYILCADVEVECPAP